MFSHLAKVFMQGIFKYTDSTGLLFEGQSHRSKLWDWSFD